MPSKKKPLVRWRPHGATSPYVVLKAAQADAAAGRYEAALAKHDWFFQKAGPYEASPFGPRLTLALAEWVKLGRVYPPAMAHLVALRDETGERVRHAPGGTEAFVEFEAINRHLGEDERTAKEFRWLDRNRGLIARRTFDVAFPALVKTGEYKLCGKYLNARKALTKSHRLYRYLRQMPESKKYAEQQFVREAATIVALLVLNGKQELAEAVAQVALQHRKTPEMSQHLDKALKGTIPPWP